MAISLGDATLIFKGDETELDQAFSNVPAKAQASFEEASKYVEQFQEDLDATADNVAYAGEKIMSLTQAFRTLGVAGPDLLKAKLDDAKTAFETLKDAGVTAQGTLLQATIKVTEREIAYKKALGDSTQELRNRLEELQKSYSQLGGAGEGSGLEEANKIAEQFAKTIGVEIPKGITDMIGGLGNIKGAVSAAFAPTAILAFVAAVAELVKMYVEWEEKQKELRREMELFRIEGDEHLRDVQDKIDSMGSHIVSVTQGPLAGLRDAFEHMRSSADETFSAISTRIDGIVEQMSHMGTLGLGENAFLSPEIVKATNNLKDFRVALAQTMDAAQLAHPENTLLPYENALNLVRGQLITVNKLIQDQINSGLSTPKTLEGWEAEVRALNNINVALEKGKQLEQARRDAAQVDIVAAAAQHQAELAKQALDQQLADIDKWKADRHAALVRDGANVADWAAVQVHAADLARIAQEQYQESLVQTYTKAGLMHDAQKAQAALTVLQTQDATKAEEQATAATEAHLQTTRAIFRNWQNMINQHVDQEWLKIARSVNAVESAQRALVKSQEALDAARTARNYQAQIDQIEILAQTGVIDEQEAAARLNEIYRQEEQDQLRHLEIEKQQMQDAVQRAQAQLDAANLSPFVDQNYLNRLKENLAKALAEYNGTLTKIEQLQTDFDSKIAKTGAKAGGGIHTVNGLLDQYKKKLIDSRGEMTKTQKVFDAVLADATAAIGTAISAWILGQASLGAALRQSLTQYMANLAGKSIGDALYFLAWGIADTFWNPGRAAADFAAAATFAEVAAVAGVAAVALRPHGGGGQPSKPAGLPPAPTTEQQQNPTQIPTTTVVHLAAGGLITQPTLAIVGDSLSASKGRAREAILPLDDPRAMDQIASAVSDRLQPNFALHPDVIDALQRVAVASTQHNYYIKGDVIDYNHLMKQQSRMVKRGRGRNVASDSLRVTKRA